MFKRLSIVPLIMASTVSAGFSMSTIVDSSKTCRCLPSENCWPSDKDWDALAKSLDGKLIKPSAPLSVCKDSASKNCKDVLKNIKNPFYMQSDSGRNESQGWLGAWSNQASSYAVEAKDTQDIVKAVNFAREHNLRLVIKEQVMTI